MSDLHVEAVESLDDADVPRGVDAPEYVLYGGKGGVGKTTMAAATALASARDGTATLVVSTDPAHSLSDSLGTEVPAEPARVHDEHPLYGVEIDPEAMQEGPFAGGEMDVDGLGGLGGLLGGDGGPFRGADSGDTGDPFGGGGVGGDGPFDTGNASGGDTGDPLSGPMPGADEAAAVQLLLQYLDDDRFERVVVDTAPTGHTLRLLELPDVMDSMVGRLLSFRERLSGMMSSVTGMFGGDEAGMDPEQGLEDLRELSARVERLRDALRDPDRADFRVVMVPEEMSVVETERLVEQLRGFDIPVGTLVVNRVMQDLAEVSGVETDWFVAPDLESCAFCRRRWEVQRNALSRAQDLFRGVDVKRVPLFADEVRGEETLRVVAACLG
jgi:arsenite-transporting ATPase